MLFLGLEFWLFGFGRVFFNVGFVGIFGGGLCDILCFILWILLCLNELLYLGNL